MSTCCSTFAAQHRLKAVARRNSSTEAWIHQGCLDCNRKLTSPYVSSQRRQQASKITCALIDTCAAATHRVSTCVAHLLSSCAAGCCSAPNQGRSAKQLSRSLDEHVDMRRSIGQRDVAGGLYGWAQGSPCRSRPGGTPSAGRERPAVLCPMVPSTAGHLIIR